MFKTAKNGQKSYFKRDSSLEEIFFRVVGETQEFFGFGTCQGIWCNQSETNNTS